MSQQKTIHINPELFKVKNNTRKKRDGTNPIRIKSTIENKNKTNRNRILRYIREQQEKNYQDLITENKKNETETVINGAGVGSNKISLDDDTFVSDFKDSIAYLKNLVEEEDKKKQTVLNHNSTLKYRTNNTTNVGGGDNIQLYTENDSSMHLKPRTTYPLPTYGCLKGGKLPTYRNYMSQTLKNTPAHQTLNASQSGSINIQNGGGYQPPTFPNRENPIIINDIVSASLNNDVRTQMKTQLQSQINEVSQTNPQSHTQTNAQTNAQTQMLKNISQITQMKQMGSAVNKPMKQYLPKKQKRTIRRNYTVGKSKKHPKIGVLISNKTIRKNITTKAQLLKQEPIQEVKKFLVKKGFIKIGSTAPNDILRKMYESAILVGGEINNHNSDNLLYNYLNS
jgi:hypothetical protein